MTAAQINLLRLVANALVLLMDNARFNPRITTGIRNAQQIVDTEQEPAPTPDAVTAAQLAALRDDVQANTRAVQALSQRIDTMSATMQTAIDALTAQVTALTDVDASAVALISGFSTRLQTAIDAATAAGASATQIQAVTDLANSISTNNAELAAAVSANTPAADPAPTPAPDATPAPDVTPTP